MSTHRLCLHGHFYQPTREDPWTGVVPAEASAAPYHDWNERITAQCYASNTAARVLDPHGGVAQTLNTFAWISFDIGPTLLSWLRTHATAVHAAIRAADAESVTRWGHGNAMAQAYHHCIMPLCNARDRYTQMYWGLRAFERHFDRRPEGLWLPETAVDLATLDVAARLGFRFTVLAPHQAALVAPLDDAKWYDVRGAIVDPTMPYAVELPCGRPFSVFFYDGPISRAVAFEHLLQDGERWLHRLLDGFTDDRAWTQLMHIATDGESYGHHHVFGEMALAYLIQRIRQRPDVTLTNYGAHLAAHPPTHRVQLAERTAWSCAHGIERWQSDCGCHTGGEPGWRQAWRTPLRAALDALRDALAEPFERVAGTWLCDPWAARNDYVELVDDDEAARQTHFFRRHARRRLTADEEERVLLWLELQRHAMAMYTSCGWFFADAGGLETAIVVRHARRAAQLADALSGTSLESTLYRQLHTVHSNRPDPSPTAWLERLWTNEDVD